MAVPVPLPWDMEVWPAVTVPMISGQSRATASSYRGMATPTATFQARPDGHVRELNGGDFDGDLVMMS